MHEYQTGPAASARFSFPQGIAVNPVNGDIIVADYGNEYIRVVSKQGIVSTLAGTGACAHLCVVAVSFLVIPAHE